MSALDWVILILGLPIILCGLCFLAAGIVLCQALSDGTFDFDAAQSDVAAPDSPQVEDHPGLPCRGGPRREP